MNKLYKKTKNKGFVILFSIVISTIILLVASSMYTISKKQTVLSSYARESQKAFYAANSALECALYYDNANIDGTVFPITAEDGYKINIKCGGNEIFARKLKTQFTGKEEYTHSFVFRYPVVNMDGVYDYNNGCAYVLVEKKDSGNGEIEGTRNLITRITAVGFNICEENIKANNGYIDIPEYDNPMLLERRISSGYTTVYYE